MQKEASLREKVMKGGVYLILRQALGLVIGLVGMLLLSRIIGPTGYGLYSSVYGIILYMISVSGLGINVYLVRNNEDDLDSRAHIAFTMLVITSVIILLIGLFFAPIISYWVRNEDFTRFFRIILISLPLISLILPSTAKLERELNYKAIAWLEFGGQLIFYGISLLLAYNHFGVWAPVIGYLVQQTWMALGSTYLSGFKPRFVFDKQEIKEMIQYGFGYSSSMWVWQLRNLINPMIVGRFAGTDAVGYVALSIRMVEALSFIKNATWRISISALAKIQNDTSRLKKALDEAMSIQVLALGPFLMGFAVVSPFVIPVLFGQEWIPVIKIYPFIALSYLVNSVFNMHSSVLYVLKRNWSVTIFHIGHILLFGIGSYIFVPIIGVIGYGLGEIFAFLAYLLIHYFLTKLFLPSYNNVLPWLVSFSALIFVPMLEFPWSILLVLPLLVTLIFKKPRQQLMGYASYFLRRA